MDPIVIFTVIVVVILLMTLIWLATRYKRCPSDKILVVYGKVSSAKGVGGLAARCYHGGGAFVWPVVQDYSFLDLTPMSIDIGLTGALSQQNIRVNVPSAFTVGVSTEPGIMENAAERLLGMPTKAIMDLARDLIFGQMRVVIATMPIEEINADRDKLVLNISNGVEVELKKVGLRLINVNIQDITDESGYIEALGKEAAARAINDAKIKVSQKERDGDIGKADADQQKRVKVAQAQASAIMGENEAAVQIANSNASRKEREAEAQRVATAAERVKSADALRESYVAEELAERQRAKKEEAAQTASILVGAEIDKKRIEILAEAEAEKVRRLKRGEADGILLVLEAQAQGQKLILEKKAEALGKLVEAAGGQPQSAAQLLITDMLPRIVEAQAKAISGIKIDKISVWDTGRGADGKSSTANFISGMLGSLPPLHEVAKQAGLDLPAFLGTAATGVELGEHEPSAPAHPVAPDTQNLWQKAYSWALSNHQSLLAYDTNKDGKLSVDDVSMAVAKAVRWTRLLGDEALQWVVTDGRGASRTLPWKAITALPNAAGLQISPAAPASAADSGSLPVGFLQTMQG